MRSDIYRHHRVTFEVEHCPQITFDDGRVNGAAIARGKPVDLVGTQTRIERIRPKDNESGLRASLLGLRQVLQVTPERPRRPEATTSPVARVGLTQSSIQIDQAPRLCIGHPFAERFRNPGILVLDHKLRYLRPLAGRQRLELLDQLGRAHTPNLSRAPNAVNEKAHRLGCGLSKLPDAQFPRHRMRIVKKRPTPEAAPPPSPRSTRPPS